MKSSKLDDGNKARVSSKRLSFRKGIAFFAVAFFLIAASVVSAAFYYNQRFVPNTTVVGVPVGGLTLSEGRAAVLKRTAIFSSEALKLHFDTHLWSTTPGSLDIHPQIDLAISKAYAVGKEGTVVRQIEDLALAFVSSHVWQGSIDPVSSQGLKTFHDTVLKDIEQPGHETTLAFGDTGTVKLQPGTVGKELDKNSFEVAIAQALENGQKDINLQLQNTVPKIDPAQALVTQKQAEQILAKPWQLQLAEQNLTLSPKEVVSFLDTTNVPDINPANGAASGHLVLVIKSEVVQKYLQDLASRTDRKPVNAAIKFDTGVLSVASAALDGRKLDVAASADIVKSALLSSTDPLTYQIALVTAAAPADLSATSLASMGIKELIGTATTDFSGSPTNRIINITVGQKAINGSLIKDGETFSTIGTLGQIDQTTGYVQELVILNNRTVPAYGGGLCQVSTTLFRSVLNAGLPIVERTNHAYRVSYYEVGTGPGLDATIYENPDVDFKWKNDTGHAIYIQSSVKGNTITFELYGTKDGRISTISAPQILETLPVGDPINSETDTLFKGETKQIEHPHAGAKTVVNYTVTRDGKQIYSKDFKSYYKAWPAQFLVGTKDRPAAT